MAKDSILLRDSSSCSFPKKQDGQDDDDEMEKDFVPSRDLALLARRPLLNDILSGLDLVAQALGATSEQHFWIESLSDEVQHEQGRINDKSGRVEGEEDKAGAQEGEEEGEEEEKEEKEEEANRIETREESFEMRYVNDWLMRIISSGIHWCEKEADIEMALEKAARLLAIGAGKSASGASLRVYHFPVLGSFLTGSRRTAPRLVSVRTREATLTEDALGGRTWGSAPLLTSCMLAKASRAWSSPSTIPPSSSSGVNENSVKILELGAGTGLVGLAMADLVRQTLPSSRSNIIVEMTDFHPDVLHNLTMNCHLNGWDDQDGIKVEKLDWKRVYDEERVTEEEERDRGCYDVLVAADCTYEKEHSKWIQAVTSRHLSRRYPYQSQDITNTGERAFEGALYMLFALRKTHQEEAKSVYDAFPRYDEVITSQHKHNGKGGETLRLCIVEERILSGYDDFGPPKLILNRVEENLDTQKGQPSHWAKFKRKSRRYGGTKTLFRQYEIRWCKV